MRLFETLAKKPVLVWEIEVVGSELRTREGGALEVQSFPSESDAQAAAEALIAARTTAGFVEIHRRRTVAQGEPPVKRTEAVEWREGYLRRYARIHQDDRQVLNETGHVFRSGPACVDRKERWFMSIREASQHFDQAIAEARLRADAPIPPPVIASWAPESELERHCHAAPDDADAFRVIADRLVEHGDPRGELAGLAINGDPAQARALLEHTFGDLWAPGLELHFELRHGFPRSVRFEIARPTDAPAAIERVLRSPLCVFVESVAIESGYSERMDPEAVAGALVAACRDRLRALALLEDSVPIGELAVGAAILDGELTTLRHLRLQGRWLYPGVIERLATCKLVPQLESLRLTEGCIEPDGIAALVRHAHAFEHLAPLEMSRIQVEGHAKRRTTQILRKLPNAIVDLYVELY